MTDLELERIQMERVREDVLEDFARNCENHTMARMARELLAWRGGHIIAVDRRPMAKENRDWIGGLKRDLLAMNIERIEIKGDTLVFTPIGYNSRA